MLKDAMDQMAVKTLMGELRKGLQTIYEDRLKGMYLYGSYARGEADSESDLDILVVLDRIDHYSDEIKRSSQLGADLSLKYGVSISKVYMRERDWLKRESPFLANVRDEAIAA